MAEEPQVIEKELEDTRHALAEKLEQIGEKISGTMETVSDTVSNVTETVSNVTEAVGGTVQTVAETVSGTVESVKDTVSAVGEKAAETVQAVTHAFNLSEKVRRHPWVWFGGSVVVGFVGGKLLLPRGSRTPEAEAFLRGNGYHAEEPRPTEERFGREEYREPARAEEETRFETGPSLLGSLAQHFGSEIGKLKELALGTLFGVARDTVARALPESLKRQVSDWFNDVTEKVGGQLIREPILGDSEQGKARPEEGGAEQPKGAEHEHQQSNPTEMDRPLGATERKSKATVGKSNR